MIFGFGIGSAAFARNLHALVLSLKPVAGKAGPCAGKASGDVLRIPPRMGRNWHAATDRQLPQHVEVFYEVDSGTVLRYCLKDTCGFAFEWYSGGFVPRMRFTVCV